MTDYRRRHQTPTELAGVFYGVWRGVRVLRRLDADGTLWTVRRTNPAAPLEGASWTLTMAYRDHRLTSQHPSPDAAQAHAEDMLAAFRAKTIADYVPASVAKSAPSVTGEGLF